MDLLIYICLTIYFIFIPLVINDMYFDECRNGFIRWYFSRDESITILGQLLLWLICGGSFLWYFIYIICNSIAKTIIFTISFIFKCTKFLFIKDAK